MKIRNRINLIMFMGLFMSFILGQSLSVKAEQNGELPMADSSKGITYVLTEEDGEEKQTALNFNGNSVIIQESANTTDETPLVNIIIDKNRNGIIDNGETMAKVDGSTDIRTDLSMYGLYQEKTNQPIMITINSGKIPQLYGLLQAESDVKGADAVSVFINGGTFNNTYYVAKESTITSDGGSATVLQIDSDSENRIYYLYGLYDCDVEVKNATDAGVSLCVKNGVIGSMYMLYESDVSSDGKEAALLDIDISGGELNYFEGARNSELNTGSRKNVAVDVDITGNPKGTGSFYLLDGGGYYYKGGGYVITGSVNVDIDLDEKPEDGYSFSNLYVAYYYIVIDGDLNVRYNNLKAAYTYGAYYSIVNGDFSYICEESCDMISSNYVSYCSEITGDAEATVVGSSSTGYNYIYGFYGVTDHMQYMVGGDVNFRYIGGTTNGIYAIDGYGNSNTNSYIGGNVEINVTGGSISYVELVGDVTVRGDVDVVLTDVNSEDEVISTSYSSALYSTKVQGNIAVEAKNCKFYSFYATKYSECKKDVSVQIEKMQTTYELYGADLNDAGGNVTVLLDEIQGRYVYGVHNSYSSTKYEGDVTVTITKMQDGYSVYGMYGGSAEIEGDINIALTQCCVESYCYGFSYGNVLGNAKVVLDTITYKETSKYRYAYGIYTANALGEIEVDIKNIEDLSSLYPYQGDYSKVGNDTAVVNLSNISMNPERGYISNYAYNGQTVLTTIDEQSEILEKVTISPCGGGGKGQLTYQGHLYLGGNYVFEEDFEAKNLHFCSGQYWIPEGVTVEATENLYFSSANILLEGTLNGTFGGNKNSDGKYTNLSLCLNGGTVSQDKETIDGIYYPYELQYDGDVCSVQDTAGISCLTNTYCEGVKFAKAGANFKYAVTPNKGYNVSRVWAQTDVSTEIKPTSGLYSFVMGYNPTTVNAECQGNEIQIFKTVSDPVAILNQEYTKQNPLYDLSTVYVQNDAKVGGFSFFVDETQSLPEGLILEGTLIYGTPEKEYENGKSVRIHATAKNGVTAEFSLNIVVTEGEGKQTTQDERISIDEKNKILYLNGNSVVFEANDYMTQVYLDEDKNGIADGETPVYEGDLANYTVYGAKDAEINSSLRITMNGGNIGTLYGAENSVLSAKDNIIEMYINAGKISKLYGLSESVTDGTWKLLVETAAKVSSVVHMGENAECKGYCYKTANAYHFYGEYVLKEDLEASDVYINKELIIDSGSVLKVTNYLYCCENSFTMINGTLDVYRINNSASYTGYIIVLDGGKLSRYYGGGNIYYPVEVQTNFKNTEITFTEGYISRLENGVQKYYLDSTKTVFVTITEPEGYTAAYSLNDISYTEIVRNSFSFYPGAMKRDLYVRYTPKHITLSKQYVDPIAIVGKTYTAENPLYDVTSIKILDDTSELYGGDVSYVIKNESTLPKGLDFEGTKIIGTPTFADDMGVVKVLVMGRNGETAETEIEIRTVADESQKFDINAFVSIDDKTIDLKGVSVVILPDLQDSKKASIYPDTNHDKVADNDIALIINDATSYDLSEYTIYGHKKMKNTFQDDLSITMKGGRVYYIYGASGSGTVNGDVIVSVEGGSLQEGVTVLAGVNSQNAILEITGGEHDLYTFSVLNQSSTIYGDVHCTIGGTAKIKKKYTWPEYYALRYGYVKGNLYLTLGETADISELDLYRFYGAYQATIYGDVKVKWIGKWKANYTYMLYSSRVYGDFEVEWDYGLCSSDLYYAYQSTIQGALNVLLPEGAKYRDENTHRLLSNRSSAKEINVNIFDSDQAYIKDFSFCDDTSKVEKSIYYKNTKEVTISGTYEIRGDENVSKLQLSEGAIVTIAKDAGITIEEYQGIISVPETACLINNGSIKLSFNGALSVYGTLENNGVLNIDSSSVSYVYGLLKNDGNLCAKRLCVGELCNNGILETGTSLQVQKTFTNYGAYKSNSVQIDSGAEIVNAENGTWEICARVSNNGRIINYGEVNQTCTTNSSYYYGLGKVLCAKELNLYGDADEYSASYTSFIYPYELDYPTQYAKYVTVTGSGVISHTLDGKNTIFIQGDTVFTITLGPSLLDEVEPEIIIYGSKEIAAAKQLDNTWKGVALHEPMRIKIVYGDEDMSKIPTILPAKQTERIENTEEDVRLVVGKSYSIQEPLYDLRDVQILNQLEESKVRYALEQSSVLPEGLMLEDGKVYGTLQEACEEEQEIVFVISEESCKPATFTLVLGEIRKGIPTWSKPQEFSAGLNKTLKDIELPEDEKGTYQWKNPEQTLGDQETTVEDVVLQFIPDDTENYDWEAAAVKEGATFEDGVLSFTVSVVISKVEPKVIKPTGITGIYGQTLAEIEIPSGENDGVFVWKNPSDKVGNVSDYSKEHLATYIPNDKDVYKEVVLPITVQIQKAIPNYATIDMGVLELECGNSLSIIELPTSEIGTYRWITDSDVVPKQDMHCQIGFAPKDSANYDWETIDGWNMVWGCVVYKVKVSVNHPDVSGEKRWEHDERIHWIICPREGCGGLGNVEVHTWDEEEVVTHPTETGVGLKKFTCKCGVTKTEEIPMLSHLVHKYMSEWKYNSKVHWHKCEYDDCEAITEPEAHQWNEGEEVLAPTETSVGIMRYTCECGATKTEPIPVVQHLTHTFNTQWGYDETSHWQMCEYEGCEEISEAQEHTWDEEEIVTRPTEDTEGVRKYTCKCGATKTETIPVLPHSDHTYADEWKYNSQMHWHVCQYEGCEAITEPTEHVWDEGVEITPATEESEGVMKHTCECGVTKTEVIPKLQHVTHVYEGEWEYDEMSHCRSCTFEGCESKSEPEAHVWDDGEEVTPATEESKGVKKYTCKCGATKTEEIPKLPHTSHVFEGEWNYDQNTHWRTCTYPECEVTSDPELHVWDEGTITVNPTETSDGEIAYVCDCGSTKTEVMPKTGHVKHVYKQTWSYDETYHWHECEKEDCEVVSEKQEHKYGEATIVKTATKEQKGTKRYTCSDCGYSFDESYVLEDDSNPEDDSKDESLNVGEQFEDVKAQLKYKVSVKDSEVELVSCGNKKATTVKISNTVVFDGIAYKVTSIANGAFKNHKKLKKVVIGSGIKLIGDKAFYGCKKLTTVTIGKNVQSIGKSAFQNCTSLKKITIPSKVKKIGSKAFYGCKKLLSVTIKTQKLNTKNVGSKAFSKVGSSNYKKLTVKVPKKKLKAYKSLLKKRGMHAKAKYKKG